LALPLNIEQLLTGRSVEWERLEFKEGWNPEDVLHSICGFANDINNWGGGYIVLGIRAKEGRPIFPPKGLQANQLDSIQRNLLDICHRLVPQYFPVAEPVEFRGKQIPVIWVPGGDNRPYKAPTTLGRKQQLVHWVRRYSSTKKSNVAEERQLLELAAKIPFDDRTNHQAGLDDLKLPLIQSFLQEVKSDLSQQTAKLPFHDLCKQMNIARGPDEYLKPLNVGLLFFNESPERFFAGTKIEVVEYRDDVGDDFSEKVFKGPIHQQLKEALQYLKAAVLKEEVRKIPGTAKAQRFYNYPYEALEEALANAVYHRSYEDLNSIEVNVRSDRIEVLSYPGPLPPVDNKQLKRPRVIARYYRNRRVGDFLKELGLTEGRGTGIPKIRKAMQDNGSPPPKFETDRQKSYFLTTLAVHSKATKTRVEVWVEPQPREKVELSETETRILGALAKSPLSSSDIAHALGYRKLTRNVRIALGHLMEVQYLVYTIPDKPRSKNQKYALTEGGKRALEKLT
jgi:ATP-dependent DNA helicase RecG